MFSGLLQKRHLDETAWLNKEWFKTQAVDFEWGSSVIPAANRWQCWDKETVTHTSTVTVVHNTNQPTNKQGLYLQINSSNKTRGHLYVWYLAASDKESDWTETWAVCDTEPLHSDETVL